MLQKHAGNLQRRRQFYGCAFSVNCSYFTGYDSPFLFRATQLLNGSSASCLTPGRYVHVLRQPAEQLQRFRRLFVFTNCFFACNVPGDVRQVTRPSMPPSRPMKIPKSVIDLFYLQHGHPCCGFPRTAATGCFALFQTQGDTTTFFVDIQNITSTTSPTLTTLDGWMFLLVNPFRKRVPGLQRLLRFQRSTVVGQVGHATSQFGTFRITFAIATHGSSPSCFRPRDTRVRRGRTSAL